MLFSCRDYIALKRKIVIYDEFVRIGKEPVIGYLKVLSWHLPGEI
jgi:hypothetical protein